MIGIEIGDRIKMARKAKKITQSDLAERVGVKRSTVGSWEINRREPSGKDLCEIAEILEVSTDYLLGKKTQEEDLQLRLMNEIKEKVDLLYQIISKKDK